MPLDRSKFILTLADLFNERRASAPVGVSYRRIHSTRLDNLACAQSLKEFGMHLCHKQPLIGRVEFDFGFAFCRIKGVHSALRFGEPANGCLKAAKAR
jgi:hypothetical protein